MVVMVVCLAMAVHCGHEVNKGQQQQEKEVNNIQEEEAMHEVNKNQQQQQQEDIKGQLKDEVKRKVNNGSKEEQEVIKEQQEHIPEVDLDAEEEIIAEEDEVNKERI